jgi:transglutaminase-like putative cysteine protease
VASLACAAAVFAHYGTLLGREPGVALLVLFLGLKLMEMRARRDLFVVIFLCFFLLLTAFFHSQSMLTGALTALAVLALLAAMLTMQFGEREQPVARRFRTAGTLLLQAMPIAVLLFLLFPRVQGPLWGLPDDARSGGTGLSESMSPGQISNLTQSEAIAFRVLFEDDAPPPAGMYWRGPVFGEFDGRTWKPLGRTGAPLPLASVQGDPASTLRYTVTLEPNDRPWLFALEAPVRVDQLPSGGALLMPDMLLMSRVPVTQRLRYRLESQTDYRFGLNETPESLRNWLRLPEGFNPRTRELARRWREEASPADAPQAHLQRALAMFGSPPFRYTLRPPLLGRDGVDEFLFESRAGFCEHYAGALVVLMRELGIPARVVTGYQGAERNPVDGYWVVRQADAHAWAEVWLEGRGWVRVDPTAAIAPERIERGSRAFRPAGQVAGLDLPLLDSLRFNFEALGNAWSQWVLSYDHARQRRLLERLGFDLDWQGLIGLLAAGLALLIGGVALLTLHPRRAKDPVERCYAEFCQRLAAAGVDRAPHETSHRLLERAERSLPPEAAERARAIVALYNLLRYGSDAPARGERVRHLRSLVHAFRP